MTHQRRPEERPEAGWPPDDVDAALRTLRTAVAFPPTPDLAAAVHHQITSGAATSRHVGVSFARLGWPRGLALAGAALLLLIGAALSLSGDLRSAVADRLGIPGIRLQIVDDTPPTPTWGIASPPSTAPSRTPAATPTASPVGLTLLLGEPASLVEAQAAIPYPIKVPTALGEPDEVYVRPVSEGLMVALLYRTRPGLPAAAETGVGALFMQFPAGPDSADIAKKVLLGQGALTEVTVDGELGYWVTGASELVIIADPASSIVEDPGRPSANVLLWASGGITYRLETALPLTDALALAESLTSAAPGTPAP